MLSIPHLIVIFIVALVVFGPQKLPELARTLGRVMAEFRRATNELRGTFEEQMRELERETQAAQARKLEAAPTPETNPQSVPAETAAAAPTESAPESPKPLDDKLRTV